MMKSQVLWTRLKRLPVLVNHKYRGECTKQILVLSKKIRTTYRSSSERCVIFSKKSASTVRYSTVRNGFVALLPYEYSVYDLYS